MGRCERTDGGYDRMGVIADAAMLWYDTKRQTVLLLTVTTKDRHIAST
jgi:hypothetical protein